MSSLTLTPDEAFYGDFGEPNADPLMLPLEPLKVLLRLRVKVRRSIFDFSKSFSCFFSSAAFLMLSASS